MSNVKLTPATRVPVTRIKKRPRGKSFEPGNGFGSATRYKKGESGNPLGRPACKEISKALREILASTKPMPAKTGAEKLARKWFTQSLGGNVAALVALANRTEGCPAVSISHDGSGDNLTLILAGIDRRSGEIGPPENSYALTAGEEADGD